MIPEAKEAAGKLLKLGMTFGPSWYRSVEEIVASACERYAARTRDLGLETPTTRKQTTQETGKHIIAGARLRCLIANAHRLLRTNYKHRLLWALVSDLTGHGSTYSIEICEQAGYDAFQICSVKKLACLSPDVASSSVGGVPNKLANAPTPTRTHLTTQETDQPAVKKGTKNEHGS